MYTNIKKSNIKLFRILLCLFVIAIFASSFKAYCMKKLTLGGKTSSNYKTYSYGKYFEFEHKSPLGVVYSLDEIEGIKISCTGWGNTSTADKDKYILMSLIYDINDKDIEYNPKNGLLGSVSSSINSLSSQANVDNIDLSNITSAKVKNQDDAFECYQIYPTYTFNGVKVKGYGVIAFKDYHFEILAYLPISNSIDYQQLERFVNSVRIKK